MVLMRGCRLTWHLQEAEMFSDAQTGFIFASELRWLKLDWKDLTDRNRVFMVFIRLLQYFLFDYMNKYQNILALNKMYCGFNDNDRTTYSWLFLLCESPQRFYIISLLIKCHDHLVWIVKSHRRADAATSTKFTFKLIYTVQTIQTHSCLHPTSDSSNPQASDLIGRVWACSVCVHVSWFDACSPLIVWFCLSRTSCQVTDVSRLAPGSTGSYQTCDLCFFWGFFACCLQGDTLTDCSHGLVSSDCQSLAAATSQWKGPLRMCHGRRCHWVRTHWVSIWHHW